MRSIPITASEDDFLDEPTQICRRCLVSQPISAFDLRSDTGRRRGVCKSCRRVAQRRPLSAPRRRTMWLVGSVELLRCRKCGEMKPWTEFPRRGKDSDRLQTWCKTCFSAYKAERHQRNHAREMARIRRNQLIQVATNRAQIATYLQSNHCVDCGESDPIVLDFDHVRGTKLHEVSLMVANGYPWAKILEEIAKCEVRCSNCHRRVTARRRLVVSEPLWLYGDPGATRTPDQQLRRLLL